jgi:hypothetical protein
MSELESVPPPKKQSGRPKAGAFWVNHADIPGLIAVTPFIVAGVCYFGTRFRDRPRGYFVGIVASLLLIEVFLVFRHFTDWGNVYF